MYRFAMLLPILAFAMAAQVPSNLDPGNQGSALFHDCRTAIRLMDGQTATATESDFLDGASCTSYIDGYTDGLADGIVCTHGASLGVLARVYVAYMQKNPKLLDEHKSRGVLLALRESYACPAK